MKLSQIYKMLKGIDFSVLPGLEAQIMMAPTDRRDDIRSMGIGSSPVLSGVLFLIYPLDDGSAGTVLIQRPKYNGVHSGQISFPGGRYEVNDSDLQVTALREANEEVGVDPGRVEVMGKLSDLYIPPSNHLVSPFVGIMHEQPEFSSDPVEVESIITMPLAHFFEDHCVRDARIRLSSGKYLPTPCYDVDGHIVWGATAMMIAEFVQLVTENQANKKNDKNNMNL